MQDEQFVIERAVRKQALLRLAISAVSGAGKTMGALRLARGIVTYMIDSDLLSGTLEGKIGVVDTERNSASLYGHLYPFDRINLEPPYSVKRYLGAARAMANAGKTVIIIDQISHQWAGQGGMLEFVDLLRSKAKGNEFAAWKDATPEQNEFLEGLLSLPCHLICTMRAKTQYVMEERTRRDGTKTHVPKRVGLRPIQREGVEYEFTTVIDLDLETKTATVSKDRTSLFVDPETLQSKRFVLNEPVGAQIARWLYEGEKDAAPPMAAPAERLQAVADSAKRQIEAAETVPDLARIWDTSQKAVREFIAQLDPEHVAEVLADVEAAKDLRKRSLGGDRNGKTVDTSLGEDRAAPAAAGFMEPTVTKAEEDELRALLAGSDVRLSDLLGRYSLVRIAALKRTAFADCKQWLLSVASKAGEKDHFADMEDDIPFISCSIWDDVIFRKQRRGVE